MASEVFDWKAVFEFTVKNAALSKVQVDKLRTSVEELEKAGKLAENWFQEIDSTLKKGRGLTEAAKQANALAKAQGQAIEMNKKFDAAQVRTNASVNQLSASLPRLRYALYDVSSSAFYLGAALTAISVSSFATAIKFQRDFADVQRTAGVTGNAAIKLRDDFNELYSSLPVAFGELTAIGAIAGQLNIASSDLAAFTEVVAKFSATTNVSVEDSATALGRLAQLLPDVGKDYEGLADSILKVGVNSIATESQIIAIASNIAGIGASAGLSSKEVVAFSGALASVGTQPELARGVTVRLFGSIEAAIAGGGARLEAFAQLSGRTAAQFRSDFSSDAYGVVEDTLAGIGAQGANATTAIRGLGITASRDIPVILKLAQSGDLLSSSLENSTNAAGETARQYNVITSTVAEKITVLINNFNLLNATVGDSALGIGLLVDAGIALLRILTDIASNPTVSTVLALSTGFTLLVGVALLASSMLLRFTASTIAARTAIFEATGGTYSLSVAMQTLLGTTTASTGALSAHAAAAGADAAATNTAAASTSKFSSVLGKAGLIGALAAAAIALDTFVISATQKGISDLSFNANGLRKNVDEYLKILEDGGSQSGELIAVLVGASSNSTENQFANFFADLPTNSSTLANFKEEAANLDAALAQLAATNAPAAQAAIDAYSAGLLSAGVSQEAINNLFGFTLAALQQVPTAAQTATSAYEELASQVADTISVYKDSSNQISEQESALYSLGQSLAAGGNDFSSYSEAGRTNLNNLMSVIDALAAQTPGDAAATANSLQGLFNALVNGAGVSANQLIFLQNMIAGLGGAAKPTTVNLGSLTAGMTKTGNSAGGAAKKVRTLVDYANDLGTVFGRAFDIRFGSQSAIDDVTSSFQDLADRIRDAQTELLKLTADKNVKEYFLSVANAYGDTLRAGILTGEIADINGKIAETQADASTELTGNSKAAIKNRKTITGLVSEYQDYIQALAASGADQGTLNAAVAQSKSDFMAQATALGYSTAQLQPYVAGFVDMATAIARIPRNITVTANADPAIQAMNELEAAARRAGGAVSAIGSTPLHDSRGVRQAALEATILARSAYVNQLRQAGNISGAVNAASSVDLLRIALQTGQFYTGGYTGAGGKYEPAGVVHKGEYVIPKSQVNQRTGLPYADALGGVQRGSRGGSSSGYANGGFVGGAGMGVVSLSPTDRGLIRDMARQTVYAVLAESPAAMAQYVRTGNKQLQGTGVG